VTDAVVEPSEFIDFQRRETTLILLNLGVVAALVAVHVAFIGLLGPPPGPLLVALAVRFVEQTLVLAWLQGATEPAEPSLGLAWARSSLWTGFGFAVLVMALGAPHDTHYSVLLVLPLLNAASRLSVRAVLALTAFASLVTIGQVWLMTRTHPGTPATEYFEAAMMALLFAVVAPVVAYLVRIIRRGERELQQHVKALGSTRDRLIAEEKFAAVGRLASAVAHEIRNPITLIVSSLKTANQPQTPAALRNELFEITTREASRLERLTTDLLAYARARPLDARETSLETSLSYVADILRAHAAAKALQIVVHTDPSVHATMDAHQMHQALLNLGLNAVAASPEGSTIVLSAARRDGQTTLAVENPGPAIDADVCGHLFEPFFTTRADGTGLGLSIVRKIAREHGGDVGLAVNERERVRFEITLPETPGEGRVMGVS